jgi:hypothetical protein
MQANKNEVRMKVPFTKQQIAFATTQAASGTPVVKIKRKIGISELTFYRFEKQFTGGRLRTPSIDGIGWSLSRLWI